MIRAFSFGGGVQSTAALVLAAQGEIDYPLFLFANVGADSENPKTLEYVENIARPYASANDIELVELHRVRRNGDQETLMQRIERDARSIPIPMRSGDSGAPGRRTCTGDFKIKVIARELKRRGATAERPAISGLGISRDEWQRMRTESGFAHQRLSYPLIDLELDRQDCVNIISRAGLPVPPKSSCFFCPFHRIEEWRRMRREEPELFAKSTALERVLTERNVGLGRVAVYLTRKGKPLDEAIGTAEQLPIVFDEDNDASCDIAGYCMT